MGGERLTEGNKQNKISSFFGFLVFRGIVSTNLVHTFYLLDSMNCQGTKEVKKHKKFRYKKLEKMDFSLGADLLTFFRSRPEERGIQSADNVAQCVCKGMISFYILFPLNKAMLVNKT